jgi:hypothetical protein
MGMGNQEVGIQDTSKVQGWITLDYSVEFDTPYLKYQLSQLSAVPRCPGNSMPLATREITKKFIIFRCGSNGLDHTYSEMSDRHYFVPQ